MNNETNDNIQLTADRQYTVNSGDVILSVREYGSGHDESIVLVHGYPDNSSVWDGVIPPLARHLHVITYDVRGAGESTAPANKKDYSLGQLSMDFQAVINRASPDSPVHILAHDWGSIQSWESVTEPSMQHRIRSFTTVSGPCLDHVGCWMRDSAKSLSPDEIKAAMNQLFHSWYIWMMQLPLLVPTIARAAPAGAWERMLEQNEGIRVKASPGFKKDALNGIQLYRKNMLPRLRKPRKRHTSVPVQQVILLDDAFVVPEATRLSVLPWVKHLWVKEVKAGHWLPLSDPYLLAGITLEFIQQLK